MNKVKIVLWIIFSLFIVINFFENRDFFQTKQGLMINFVFKKTPTPELHNVIYFVICFFTGILLAYFSSLFDRFRCNKMIRYLNSANDAYLEMISALKNEVESLKGGNGEPMPKSDAESTSDVN
jgi:hypothetical protein